MGKPILTTLLGGILVLGVSTAFAEQPQVADQDGIQAQFNAQTEVQQIAEPGKLGRTGGPQLLTDEELEQITGAGFGGLELGTAGEIIHFGFRTSKFIVHKLFFNDTNMTSQ